MKSMDKHTESQRSASTHELEWIIMVSHVGTSASAHVFSHQLLVLGHSDCGAVKGSIDREAVKSLDLDKLNHLLDDINPAVEVALQPGDERTSANKDLVARAIRENVRVTIDRIRQKSPDLVAMEEAGKIKIVGGIYDLATGKISWM